MSNVFRKIQRNIADSQGLPRGFYGDKMQKSMANTQRAINKMNKLIEESRQEILMANELANELTQAREALDASEETAPHGEESNTDLR